MHPPFSIELRGIACQIRSHLGSHGFHRPAQALHQPLLLERPREVALGFPAQKVDVDEWVIYERQHPERHLKGTKGRGDGRPHKS